MLELAGMSDGEARARRALEDGSAYEKFIEMIEAQGSSRAAFEGMRLDSQPLEIAATQSGFVKSMDVVHLGELGRRLSQRDSLGGLRIVTSIGDRVEPGDIIACAYGPDKQHAADLASCFTVVGRPVTPPPLIYERSMSEIK